MERAAAWRQDIGAHDIADAIVGDVVRLLGIPAIRDRVGQAAFKLILLAIWVREGRSPRKSTKSALEALGSGKQHVPALNWLLPRLLPAKRL